MITKEHLDDLSIDPPSRSITEARLNVNFSTENVTTSFHCMFEEYNCSITFYEVIDKAEFIRNLYRVINLLEENF